MSEDKNVRGSSQSEGPLWVFLYQKLDGTGHGERTGACSTAAQRASMAQSRMLLR